LKGKPGLPEVISNTSPLQYLHQLESLDFLRRLAGKIIVPEAVAVEIEEGRMVGVDLPDLSLDWIRILRPESAMATALSPDLGPGETQALMLALERPESIVILDDALARRFAGTLGIRFTGTLGILIDAKRTGCLEAVAPLLDRLHDLGFWLDGRTKSAVLRLAGEQP
jgi:predicted nucleic acid-binding protein